MGQFNPPSYNLLRYEIKNTSNDREILKIYLRLLENNTDCTKELFHWFSKLTPIQLDGINISTERNLDPSDPPLIMFQLNISKRIVLVCETTVDDNIHYFNYFDIY